MSAMEMSTAYKQKGHLIISVDSSLMDSDGENYHMFNEPKGCSFSYKPCPCLYYSTYLFVLALVLFVYFSCLPRPF